MKLTKCFSVPLVIGVLTIAPAAHAQQVMKAPTPDPRVGLKPGTMIPWAKDTSKKIVDKHAAEAAWNLKLISATPPSENFLGVTNSDLAFTGKYVIQGNYNGYQVWDISNPAKPVLTTAYLCPASQSDVSVYNNLVFVSSESVTGRLDCGRTTMDSIDANRIRGIRVFDGTDITKPKYLTNVQTCRGSHTHTVVTDPKDKDNVYIYISGTAGVRPDAELKGCLSSATPDDPKGVQFRLEVIKVPLAHPELAAIVSSPRVFNNLPASPANTNRCKSDSTDQAISTAARAATAAGRGGRAARPVVPCNAPPTNTAGPNQCHDITVYPAIGFAGGACAGLGLLLDIRDPAHPTRTDFVADSNFSFWHSATFSNDGSKILFTDEWGGGRGAKCRASDKLQWGADAIFTLTNGKMKFQSYYKMPAPQTKYENCVAHNGSLIPIPGREVMVQAWYQGGVSVFDWTDAMHPMEIAYFDRGPLEIPADTMAAPFTGGSWSAYWYNGVIVSSEIARGLDIFELPVSPFLTKNELDAAKTVHFNQLNVQDQPKMVWPPSFALARAFVDQLERSKGLPAARITAVRSALADAEKAAGPARKTALTTLATQLGGDVSGSTDKGKLQMLTASVRDLAK